MPQKTLPTVSCVVRSQMNDMEPIVLELRRSQSHKVAGEDGMGYSAADH